MLFLSYLVKNRMDRVSVGCRLAMPADCVLLILDSLSKFFKSIHCNNLLLTEREGRTGEYWPEVMGLTERSEVRTKTTEGQYSPVRLELARLVSSLLYGTRAMLVLNLPAFENKKIHSRWPFPWKLSVWRIIIWLCLTRTGNYQIHEFDWLKRILTAV